MTIAATAGTLVVAVAVMAGPSILQCSSSADGLLACLREQVVEVGLLPPPADTPTVTPQVATEPALEAPAPTSTVPTVPDVNLVRAEPDGNVIVAGTAAPGIEVEVFANGDLVGKAMAEASGDWVVVPDRPLAVGTATISAGAAGSNARSPHTFTVVIPEDRSSTPIITLSEPSQPETATQPATEPVEGPPQSAREPASSPPAAEKAEPADVPTSAPAEPPPQEEAIQPEATLTSPPSQPEEPPLQTAAAGPAVAPQPDPPPATPVPAQPATIDAIEIDGVANYFAGAGPEGAMVQLYVEDRFVASAQVEGGRWLVEARGALILPVQRVRIELTGGQQAAIAARAEVNFVIDVPPPAPEIAVTAAGSGSVTPPATAALELAIDPAIPTLHAMPTADPQMLRFASGKAIIRRGETLWAIAKRVYGDGSQYRRIVEANSSLINSPGRIFPGQVFDLPKLQDRPAEN